MRCRLCSATLRDVFVDLVAAPPSNSYLTAAQLDGPETYFPLKLFVCRNCWLVQVPEHESSERIFAADYAYFSSYSSTWLEHAQRYVATAVERLGLRPDSFVVEVAANDGYLLQYVAGHGIRCVGIEPTASTAAAARARGIDTIEAFFGRCFAEGFVAARGHADLLLGNNVYAHVPDLNDFTAGLKFALAPGGTLTLEFPHLMRLVEGCQFDTIYHEHFSYFSLCTAERVLAAHGLRIWDVEELPTHGGSLRLWVVHLEDARETLPVVSALRSREAAAGMQTLEYYADFQVRAERVKNDLLAFLLQARREGKRLAAYGAAAKGNTLLNYAGIKPDLLPYVVDASPHKKGRFLPGSRIPVVDEARLRSDRPDCVLILPWNLKAEIEAQLLGIRAWGGRFVVAVPHLVVW
ncbi:MAG: methyltransferase domain-containing protein [Burkholderiales bacterium]|nr:methyltransferase domain-containing protein [Burkholderiales bacterium]